MLERLAKLVAWGWLVFIGGWGLIVVAMSERGGEVFAGWAVFFVGLAPLGLLIWAGQARKARWAAVHAQMLAAAGGSDVSFEHAEEDSGIAVNPAARAITLLLAGQWKTYAFDDVRKWRTTLARPGQAGGAGVNLASSMAAMGAEVRMKREAAAETGLYVEVRDIDRPKWRVAMKSEATQARWMEILNQELNESRPESARVRA